MSAASYFYAMSPLLHVKSQVMGVHQNSFRHVYEHSLVAYTLCRLPRRKLCSPYPQAHQEMPHLPASWDLSTFSDQALTLAAIAPFANEPVGIEGISHIRLQECDRVNAIEENLAELGVRVEETENGLRIYPAECIKP